MEEVFYKEDLDRNKLRLDAVRQREEETHEFKALEDADRKLFEERKALFLTMNPDLVYDEDSYADYDKYVEYFFEHNQKGMTLNKVFGNNKDYDYFAKSQQKDYLEKKPLLSLKDWQECVMDYQLNEYLDSQMEPPEIWT